VTFGPIRLCHICVLAAVKYRVRFESKHQCAPEHVMTTALHKKTRRCTRQGFAKENY